jgi:hypothetical protein
MTWLLENPVPIWTVGAALGIFAGLVFLTWRTMSSLLVLSGLVGITLLLALLEWLVVTEREEVELATHQLAAAVEANDLPALLTFLAPTGKQVRHDAEALLPRFQVAKTHVGGQLHVEVDTAADPRQAISRFRALFDAVDRRTGMKNFYFFEVQHHRINQDERLLVTAYTAKFRGKTFDPVKRVQ